LALRVDPFTQSVKTDERNKSKVMKTLSTLFLIVISSAGGLPADYIRFAERLFDAKACIIDEGERFCEIVTHDGGGFTVKLTLPGFENVPFQPGTPVQILLGDFGLDADLGDFDVLTNNRAVFYYQYFDDNDRPHRYGGIAISRSSNVVTIAGGFLVLESSIVAESGQWDANGKGTVPFSLRIGDVTFQRTVYFKAVATQRPPPDPESDPLRTNTVLGKADFTRPTVTVATPKNRARVTTEMVAFQGTAKDNVAVDHVLYRVGDNSWMTAAGTSNWTANVLLPVGTNVVQVKSVDGEALESRVVSRTIIRSP
jgi:hypothetical protein